MKKPTLKPCPFCGGPAFAYGDEWRLHGVSCHNDDCRVTVDADGYTTAKAAAAAWNTRAPVDK